MNILKTIEGERKKVSYLTGGGGIPAQCIAGNIYERSIIMILVTLAPRFCHFLPESSKERRFFKSDLPRSKLCSRTLVVPKKA